MKLNIGETYEGYKVILTCEQELYGIALVKKEGKNESDFGVIGYCTGLRKNNISFFYKGMTEDEAKMDFFERSPLFLSKYDIYEDIRDELLKNEAENQIAVYVYGVKEISYEQAKKLQKMFDVDKVISSYKQYNKSDDWKHCLDRYVKENNIKLK